MKLFPSRRNAVLGVGLMTGALLILLIFFLLKAFGVVDFDTGHTWDIVLGVVVFVGLAAYGFSLSALRQERSVLGLVSVGLGTLGILFLLLHSLFITD